MPTPEERLYNTLLYFEGLDPSEDGTPREATSEFPTEIDSWPEHIDDENKKVYAQYLHNLYAALIQTQLIVKGLLTAGAHFHHEFQFEYDSGLPSPDEITVPHDFNAGSTRVYLRGRKLRQGTQYDEGPGGNQVTLTLTPPEGADDTDTIDIVYTSETP